MAERGKKFKTTLNMTPQITLLLSQFLFLIALISGFSFISGSSFSVYEGILSPISLNETLLFSLYK